MGTVYLNPYLATPYVPETSFTGLVVVNPGKLLDGEWQTDPVTLTTAGTPQIFDGEWIAKAVTLTVIVY